MSQSRRAVRYKDEWGITKDALITHFYENTQKANLVYIGDDEEIRQVHGVKPSNPELPLERSYTRIE